MDLRGLERPVPHLLLTILVVVLGVATRLPQIATADDLETGHPDAATYFWKAVAVYSEGRYEPLPHGGSGWPLALSAALRFFGVEMAPPSPNGADLVATGEATLFAYGFHAIIAAGLVVATLLLARRLLRPLLALAAAAFVAVDPFLLGHTTDLMADGLYTVLFLLALVCVLNARQNVGWLAGAGALMALAHMVRVNGLVMLAMVVAVAIAEARADGRKFRWRLVVIPIVAFAIVASPYLVWRAEFLPGAFDYGTNQRFFTDDPWNMSDAYWTHYSISGGGPRETMGDYFATHMLTEAARRLFDSIAWQVKDIVIGGADRAVIAFPILVFAAAGVAFASRERPARLFALALAFCGVTFIWIYPAVRSPRYFMPLLPLASILAAQGLQHIAVKLKRPAIAIGAVALYVALSGLPALGDTRQGLEAAGAYGSIRVMTFLLSASWVTLAAWPLIWQEMRGPDRIAAAALE